MGVGGWTLWKGEEERRQGLFQSRQGQVQGGQGLAGASGLLTSASAGLFTTMEAFRHQSPAAGCLHQADSLDQPGSLGDL